MLDKDINIVFGVDGSALSKGCLMRPCGTSCGVLEGPIARQGGFM